jgi:hypothetical protein
MRDWGMFSHEGNKKVDELYNEFRKMNTEDSSYDIWMDAYRRLLDLSQESGYEEATDSDVTTQLFWELNDKGVIKLTLDDYYNGIDDVNEKEREMNMSY